MLLEESYSLLRNSVVAFVPIFHPIYDKNDKPPEFPIIFGTGFIIDEGLIVTNNHVYNYIKRLPRPKDSPEDLWPAKCLLLYLMPEVGVAEIPLEIIGVFGVTNMDPGDHYYGPDIPDIAFIHVKMKDLPKVKVKYLAENIKVGKNVATIGFPMGTNTLTAPGYLHQIAPTLQTGVISAILPFECNYPHSIMINVMSQGGASGSPVFLPETGEVLGVLYGGLEDIERTIGFNHKKIADPSIHGHYFKSPTNISYIVPSHYIEQVYNDILKDNDFILSNDTLSLIDILNNKEKFVLREPKVTPEYQIWNKDSFLKNRKLEKFNFIHNKEKETIG